MEAHITAKRIKQLRTALKLSQRQFAKKLGHYPSEVCRWESTDAKQIRKPSVDTCHEIVALAKMHGYEITIEWLRPAE